MGQDGAILYASFKTERARYVYDTYSNQILAMPDERWENLERLLVRAPHRRGANQVPAQGQATPQQTDLDEARSLGYFRPTVVDRMAFAPTDTDVLDLIRTKIPQLSLELTEQCTSRCAYCAQNPDRPTRLGRHLDWPTARNAVEQFMQRASKVSKPIISFWGGEPLLQFPLLERVLRYAVSTYPGIPFGFTFTSNLMLMTPLIAKVLREHRVNLLVSLDGPAAIHDRYRRTPSGMGTFDSTMEGLKLLFEEAEDYYRECVTFNCVMTPGVNIEALVDFFSSRMPLVSGHRVRFSFVNGTGTTFFEDFGWYDENDVRSMREAYRTSVLDTEGTRYQVLQASAYERYFRIAARDRSPVPRTIHPNGCCLPLLKKMHVAVDGTVHLCERCELSNPLGNVNEGGIDDQVVLRLTHEYASNSLPDCCACWALRLCPTCHRDWLRHGLWAPEKRSEICERTRHNLLRRLTEYAAILERNPMAFSDLAFSR
jgi:uncharacterized protein